MKIKTQLTVATVLLAMPMALTAKNERPNVIVILCDDLGSYDVGFNGCKDIPTPNINRIANEGVNCTNAYISAPYSGPSRCGLFTGRYQQRFGAEANIVNHKLSAEQGQGVPTDELMLSELLKDKGYKTAVIGKWHMGDDEAHTPMSRGADYFCGFYGGLCNYWGIPSKGDHKSDTIFENHRALPPSEVNYVTDDFTDKAVDFINANAKDNFFVYLAYNAPHGPMHATQKYLDRTEHIANPWRSVYAAMILAVDDGVGRVWDALEKNGVDDNTIIVFLSDNGGTERAMNIPYRAWKGNMYEGGITTPFALYWSDKIKAGTEYPNYISSLDIFPTVAKAAGVKIEKLKKPLDGVDLMPYLSGKSKDTPHKNLFWRTCGGFEWAVRSGDYKVVKSFAKESLQLYNIAEDRIEMNDIADKNPEIVARLHSEFKAWNAQMVEPKWVDPHQENQIKDYKAWKSARSKSLPPVKK